MKEKQFLDKHYKRLATEGILKSVVIGSSVCFGVNLIFAFLFWMFTIGDVWWGIVSGLAVGLIAGVLIYFLKYRPDEREVARRIDRQGLEERMITMLELKDDDSVIAQLQRKDATEALESTSSKIIRYRLSRSSLVIAASILAVSICMTVVGALAQDGLIPYGKDLFGFGSDGTFEVIYEVGEGGKLIGEGKQNVQSGENTSVVLAVANDGWIFIGWDDGEKSPERYETDVSRSMVIRALFERIDNGTADTNDEGDSADDLPVSSSNSESGGGNSDEEGGDDPSQGNDGQGGGKWQDKNQFIDGATYYRDYLEMYYEYALAIFGSSNDIPQEIIEFFETYFSGI